MSKYQERFEENYSESSVSEVLKKDKAELDRYDIRNLNRYYYHPKGKKMCGWCKEVLEATNVNFAIKRHTKDGIQLNFRCKGCDKIYRESYIERVKSDPEKYCKRLAIAIKSRAKEQNLPFNITGQYLHQLLLGQNLKCYYTGKPLNFNLKCVNNNSPDRYFPSLDKLVPSKGYVEGNVVWCLWYVNRMKSDLNEDEFLSTCKTILEVKGVQ